jgi:lysophospholipase L1-like esterase
MRLKLALVFIISIFLLVSITAWYFVRKYYLSYNVLRLDPLEDSSFKKDLLIPRNNVTNIWIIGDSRVAKWNTDLLSPLDANIVNLGIEGQTTSQVLGRLKNYLETENPQWLILEVGINDLKVIGLNEGLTDRVMEGCLGNIFKIVELCQAKNVNIIIINILPIGNIELARRIVWKSSVDQAIAEVNRKLDSFCKNNGILFFDTNPILCTDKLKIKEQYQNGSLHLNDKAYEVLSKNLIKEFGPKIHSNLTTK